jgi:hypothetical protein
VLSFDGHARVEHAAKDTHLAELALLLLLHGFLCRQVGDPANELRGRARPDVREQRVIHEALLPHEDGENLPAGFEVGVRN